MAKIDFKCIGPKWPKVQEIDKANDRNEFLKGSNQREIVKKKPWVQKLYGTELWMVFYDSGKTER